MLRDKLTMYKIVILYEGFKNLMRFVVVTKKAVKADEIQTHQKQLDRFVQNGGYLGLAIRKTEKKITQHFEEYGPFTEKKVLCLALYNLVTDLNEEVVSKLFAHIESKGFTVRYQKYCQYYFIDRTIYLHWSAWSRSFCIYSRWKTSCTIGIVNLIYD